MKLTICRKNQGILLTLFITFFSINYTHAAVPTYVNKTQENMSEVISDACSKDKSVNEASFQDRCNALARSVGGATNLILKEGEDARDNNAYTGITQVAPEQQIIPGMQATRTMRGMVDITNAAIVARMGLLRAQMLDSSGKRYANRNQLQRGAGLFSFIYNPLQSGGSAGIAETNRFSIWGNGYYTGGNVDASINQSGFGFDNWRGDIGADYRVTNNFVAGAAFSYMGTGANINNSGGNVKSDSYTGSIFSMYTHNSGFYVDGTASYSGLDYDINRHIQYTVVNPSGIDAVNAFTNGRPGGSQYSVGGGIGYQFNLGSTSIEPFARANYQELSINSFNETESGRGLGWAMHFSKQNINSLPTTVGLRLSHVFSTPLGVFQPQIHGAWNHEFLDNQHSIKAYFLGNGKDRVFNTVAERPDRDYFTVGANLSVTLPYGISAYTGYSTILGYQNITSHRVFFGGRIEF